MSKNGCKVEALQLSQMDRVERALVLYMIVAWRIARLMRLGMTCPDLEASLFFHPDEIRGAHLLAKKARLTSARTHNQMIRLIASLVDSLVARATANPVQKRSGSALNALWMPHQQFKPFEW
ncbi:MAG: hypothetical protein NVSMB6_23640 [Burkholderiaceae bacterium]